MDRILLSCAAGFALVALLAFVWLALRCAGAIGRRRADRRAGGRYCPTGRGAWWMTMLLPHRLLLFQTCGYDLSKQRWCNAQGDVRCPECGVARCPHRLHAARYRVRPGRIAVGAFAVAAGCLVLSSMRSSAWVRWTPTFALVGIQEAGVSWYRPSLRGELTRRVNGGGEAAWVSSQLAKFLVADLCDDKRRWNASDAIAQLTAMGAAARPHLVKAIESLDWQQRQYAFVALARGDVKCSAPPAEAAVIRVAIEALCNDGESYFGNATAGYHYLLAHGQEWPVRCAIVDALRSTTDVQQRLLCALLCGQLGCLEAMDDAYPMLIECLEDNLIPGDARAAAPALCGFGAAVVPRLEATRRDSGDLQQMLLIDLMLFDLGAASAPAERPKVFANLAWEFRRSLVEQIGLARVDDLHGNWLNDYIAMHNSDFER